MKEVELGNEPKELVEMKEIISGRKSLLDGLTSRIASTGDRIKRSWEHNHRCSQLK